MSSTYCPECDALTNTTSPRCPVCGTRRPVEGWPVDNLVGSVFADTYTVMKRLGRGGFGVVYLAENQEFGGKRALKVLHSQHVHNDNILKRFKREAKALYRLQSPYTVRMERWGRTEDGQYYMVMEFAEGETLRRILDLEGPLDQTRALNIARQIAVALADAHTLDILHRDLKPENIVIRSHTYEGDRIAVLDFGISKILSDETDSRVSGLIGTPSYMAPENWRPTLGKADIRSDLWSLGVILYEMLVGSLPFGSVTTSDPMAMAYEACNLKPKAIASALQALSAHPLTQQIVIRLLQPVPDHRYATPAQLLSVLDTHPAMHGRTRTEGSAQTAGTEAGSLPRPVGLADTIPDTGRPGEIPAGGPEDGFLFGDEPDAPLTFQDEPPEDLKIRGRTPPPELEPEVARPAHRLRTMVIAFLILGVFALLAKFGNRLLTISTVDEEDLDSGARFERDAEQEAAGDATIPSTLVGVDGMRLFAIPGGTFTMGSPEVDSGRPAHQVRLSRFYLDETEVTLSMWLQCVQSRGCPDQEVTWAQMQPGCRESRTDAVSLAQPMTCISWTGAAAYCQAVGRRLPTEAEWEFAARGPDQEIWPAWVDPRSESHRVPRSDEDRSGFGPVNMGWSVREWVSDWWATGYYEASPPFDPTGPVLGTDKVVRGGPTADGRPVAWVARFGEDPGSRLANLGFRCALSAPPSSR